jgi:ubiquinol-cytochrome c reductase cytochrome b subunit
LAKTDQTPEERLNSPGVADNHGLEPFQKECGACHVIDGLSEGGTRDAPIASPGACPSG